MTATATTTTTTTATLCCVHLFSCTVRMRASGSCILFLYYMMFCWTRCDVPSPPGAQLNWEWVKSVCQFRIFYIIILTHADANALHIRCPSWRHLCVKETSSIISVNNFCSFHSISSCLDAVVVVVVVACELSLFLFFFFLSGRRSHITNEKTRSSDNVMCSVMFNTNAVHLHNEKSNSLSCDLTGFGCQRLRDLCCQRSRAHTAYTHT